MGLLKKMAKKRADAKVQIKAAQARAKAEVKSAAKDRTRRQKLLAQQEKNLLKAEQKGLKAKRKHELKLAKTELERRKQGRLNKDSLGRYIGVIRFAAPILLPLIYRLGTAGQEALNKRKAQRFGVSTADLAQFAGHGASLKARIAGVRSTLQESGLPRGFRMDATERLDELDKATDNAEYMTAEQRRRAHRSISEDLDMVTGQIQDRITRP